MVQTKQTKLDDDQQAMRKMTAQAYKTKSVSNNYMHFSIGASEFQIGDQIKVNLNLGQSQRSQRSKFHLHDREQRSDCSCRQLKVQVKEPPPIYEPGEGFSLQITGDTGAKVGLVAVDKAVHGLNQNRLTQTKIWYIIQKHDIGCTAGGGRDSMGVFTDAGLMFESNSAGGTNARTSMFVLSYY
ncbi:hypothetical protein QQF64_000066 [Cirrhinus molitorella]|uniref:Alpha-2-macroglobulin bait region domain-containing protein n=1 Tax=Cirrhinus molitorella TaxID=172907 RepID=A0ABR3NW78_9TELE